jgi:hypothetical protein
LISTRNLLSLSDVDRLKALLQSMALLDAILQPEWEFRYYSFNSVWATGEQLLSAAQLRSNFLSRRITVWEYSTLSLMTVASGGGCGRCG